MYIETDSISFNREHADSISCACHARDVIAKDSQIDFILQYISGA